MEINLYKCEHNHKTGKQVYLELMTASLDVHLKSLPFNEGNIAKEEDSRQNPYYIKEGDS